jgi:hypothetical protein
MASAVFSGGAGITYSEGATMAYDISGKYLRAYEIGGRDYERVFIGVPGVNGVGSKNFGFRGRKITLHVCYVGSDEGNIVSDFTTDLDALAGQATGSTLALAGQSFFGVFLLDASLDQAKSNGLPIARVWAWGSILVDAKRLS